MPLAKINNWTSEYGEFSSYIKIEVKDLYVKTTPTTYKPLKYVINTSFSL